MGGFEFILRVPQRPVEIVCAVEFGAAGGDGALHGGHRAGEPRVEVAVEGFVIPAVGARVAGGGGEFPLGSGRQALPDRPGIGAGGEPGDAHHRGIGRGRGSGLEVAGPVFQVGGIGEQPAHLRAPPLGVGGDEGEELTIGYRARIEQKGGDAHLRRILGGTLERHVDPGGDRDHAHVLRRTEADGQGEEEEGDAWDEEAHGALFFNHGFHG